MKLLELLGVKKYADTSMTELVKLMDGESFKALTAGAHATVFRKGDEVYKFWVKDRAYDAFVDYVARNQDNPWLPKLKSRVKAIPAFFLRNERVKEVRYVKIELLTPISGDPKIRINDGRDEEAVQKVGIRELCFNAVTALEKRHDNYDRFLTSLCKPHDYLINDKSALKLLSTMFDINKMVRAEKLVFDLNQQNFMMRAEQVVVIDPVKHDDDYSFNQMIDRVEGEIKDGMANKDKLAMGRSRER